LTVVWDDQERLIDTLAKMSAAVAAVANQKLQRKRPSSFQLLLNPELLDWEC
jgi:hypothetical protein